MKKLLLILGLAALTACASYNPYRPYDPYQPTVGGDIYLSPHGSGGRIGITSGNFGLTIGI